MRALLLLSLAAPALAYTPDQVPLTLGGPGYVEPASPRAPLSVRTLSRTALRDGGEHVLILVDASLTGPLADELDTWVDDIEADGLRVTVEESRGGSAAELRAHLQELYADEGLSGAVLVGDHAFPRFYTSNDYPGYELGHSQDYGDGVGMGYGPASYVTDLYLADLDGYWADTNDDGYLDVHDGSAPEIYVGRLYVAPGMGDEVEHLRAYLNRNHLFRTGSILPEGTALLYVDDDWSWWAPEYASEIRRGFDVDTYAEDATTTKADYVPRLEDGYDAVAVFVHSSPSAHFFSQPSGDGTLWYSEVPHVANALFYDLFACSNADWSQQVYMAGTYVFDTDRGLLALGSTKTGSMLERTEYYRLLGEGETFGTALHGWWQSVYPYDLYDRESWYYGLVHVGDPTLRVGYPVLVAAPDALVVDTAVVAAEAELVLSNPGRGEVAWTVSASDGWMSVSPDHGSLAHGEDVTLTVGLTATEPGLSTGELVFDGGVAPAVVPVELGWWESPEVCVSPEQIAVEARRDEANTVEIELSNCHAGPMAWTAEASAGWVQVSPDAGELADGEVVTLRVDLDAVDEDAGAVVRIAGDADAEVPVSVEVRGRLLGCAHAPGVSAVLWWLPLVLVRRRVRNP